MCLFKVALELSNKIAQDRRAIADLEAKTDELTLRAGEAEESQRDLHRTLTAQTEAIEDELRRQEQVVAPCCSMRWRYLNAVVVLAGLGGP